MNPLSDALDTVQARQGVPVGGGMDWYGGAGPSFYAEPARPPAGFLAMLMQLLRKRAAAHQGRSFASPGSDR